MLYAKIFQSIFQGTLRGQPDEILVFINLIAHADLEGKVDKHPKAIAQETGLPQERVEEALLNLEAPDHESRSKEAQGRRIIRLDEHRNWGWTITNHLKYSSDSKRDRAAMARYLRKFQPPTLDEVCIRATEIGVNQEEAQRFWHFYESKGWRVGQTPMSSWRSALAGWKLRNIPTRPPKLEEMDGGWR